MLEIDYCGAKIDIIFLGESLHGWGADGLGKFRRVRRFRSAA
jgi:hypothetical protein